MIDLRSDEGFDEGVGCLRVQTQGVTEALQFRRFLQECLLQAVTTGVEVLFNRVQSNVENRALLWRKILLHFLGDILERQG